MHQTQLPFVLRVYAKFKVMWDLLKNAFNVVYQYVDALNVDKILLRFMEVNAESLPQIKSTQTLQTLITRTASIQLLDPFDF